MIETILGRKIGMTQIFDADGALTAVTAVSAGPCVVLGSIAKNVIVGYEDIAEKKAKKPQLGMFKKLNISPKRVIRELRCNTIGDDIKVGQEIRVDIFKTGDFVDIIGTSIGRGFQGGMRRWNWSGQPSSHGSMMHRGPGANSSNTDPGRVFRGKHMPGHVGNVRVTIQNVKVLNVDQQNNILLVQGQVPGHKNSLVMIRRAKKRRPKAL